MGHIKVARWTYYTGNFQKQTFIECDRPDKRRVSYKSRRPWTFSSFYFEVKCLKRQVKHECYKISKIRAYFGYIHYFDRRIFQDVSKLLILKVILLSCYVKTRNL
jgi:hypothetical protein